MGKKMESDMKNEVFEMMKIYKASNMPPKVAICMPKLGSNDLPEYKRLYTIKLEEGKTNDWLVHKWLVKHGAIVGEDTYVYYDIAPWDGDYYRDIEL